MSTSDCEFHLGSSRPYLLWSLALHAGAVLALWLSRIDPVIALSLGAVVLVAFAHDVRTTGLRRGPAAVTTLRLRHELWSATRNDGRGFESAPLASAWVFGGVVLMRLGASPWRRASVIVPCDALSDAAFRQLRTAVMRGLKVAPPA